MLILNYSNPVSVVQLPLPLLYKAWEWIGLNIAGRTVPDV